MCYIPIPMDKSRTIAFPASLARWETAAIAVAVALLLVLALAGKGRRQRQVYEIFQRRAANVEAALEEFAEDHQGRFPPDAMFTGMPQGLRPYIRWDEKWKIDYEAPSQRQGRALRLHGILRAIQGADLFRAVQQPRVPGEIRQGPAGAGQGQPAVGGA